ncbi:unnamed protein product [Hyaloperonospora brassicae]|uniref:Uncharacterized protein n=1 Tax=Hyaloperonospora brassicae TaxID=162125 RepID=A0AAV0TVD8_HYABA|nr:unnamed protein product [Hyaloperonospora brassicae]
MATSGDKRLYPHLATTHEEVPRHVQPDTSRDAELARQLQNDEGGHVMAVAQPVEPIEMPYKCGNCGMTHVVRNVAHGSVFYCTACGAQNQILLEHRRPTVVVDHAYGFVPIPLFCSVM